MIRARMYEHTLDSDRLRFDQLMEKVEDLENMIAFITAETTRNSETLETELRDIRNEARASGACMPAARSPKNITETKGFEKLKPYAGEAAQWKDWRFKVTTWLTQTNPSFESLMIKLDQSESEPKEPEDGDRMKAGSLEFTTDEEWCSEQLYQLLV